MRRITLALVATTCAMSTLAMPGLTVAQTVTSSTGKPAFLAVKDGPTLSSSLKGLNVKNGTDETVGEISDIVIDGTSVNAYILSVGGFLGMGTHYVAVDPSALNLA